MKNTYKGFTLIELIVTIAIIGVLSGILVPMTISYVKKSQAAACQSDIQTVQKEYAGIIVNAENPHDSDTQYSCMDTAIKNLGKTVDISGSSHHYLGVCPAGGVYDTYYDENTESLCVYCTKHGVSDEHKTKINFFNIIATSDIWKEYINRVGGHSTGGGKTKLEAGISIDSGAAFKDATAPQLTELLQSMGLDTANTSYRVYCKKNATTNIEQIYLSEKNIDTLNVGDTVNVTKYNVVENRYYVGTAKISTKTDSGQTYKVLDVSKTADTFEEIENPYK